MAGQKYDLDTTSDLPTLSLAMFHKGTYSVSEVPMGVITVHLDSINTEGGVTEQAYNLECSGRMTKVSGTVTLRMRFSRAATNRDHEDIEEGEAEPEEYEDETPNELHITVVAARGLLAMDSSIFGGAGSSDPQVRVQIDGFDKQKTKFIRKTLSPVWNEKMVFPGVVDSALAVKVTVEDHNDIKPTCDFMGRVILNLADYDDKKPVKKTFKLKNKTNEADGTQRGEIDLIIHWKFNVKVKEELRQKQIKYEASTLGKMAALKDKIGKTIGTISDSEEEDDDEPEGATEKEAARPQTEEEKKKAAEEEAAKVKDLSDIVIKDGDYQVQVHIIECRDLKAENLDGTSDPVVYIDCMGQKQSTGVINGVTSCVFDELFIFNFSKMDKEAFEEGVIKISCYDYGLTGNTMIGAYAFDATMVYTLNKEHEMYRKWVPLMDDEDPDDVGVQGYMKISVSIIGPGEKLKIHDEDAELAAEIARESAAGGDIGSLVMTTPTIRKEWQYIVATIYKCEGLPVMDGKVGIGMVTAKKAGTDAYCKFSFAGAKPIKTKVVTMTGESRTMINPEFNNEMWFPVSVPTMTQMIKFSVWDKDPTESELIGNVTEKFNVIDRMQRRQTDLRWYNMYGCPEFKQEKALANIKKGVEIIAKKTKQAVGADIDWGEYYNNVPDKASTFKGRCLMKFRIETKRPEKHDKPEVKPFKRKVKALTRKMEPLTAEYVLQALVVCGTELPSFGTISNQKLAVRVSIGVHEIATKMAAFQGGQCRWNDLMRTDKILFPQDLSQVPDIFIYLVREDNKPVCFTRIKPVTNLKEGVMLGFDQPAKWHLLQEDKSIDALSADVFPGNILIKLGFGLAKDSDKSWSDWKSNLDQSKKGSPYQVRVHVYQCKHLPAADSNGLTDPYIKVNFMGQAKSTSTIYKTLYPAYYETIIFDEVMIPEYENFQYASQVTFRLYDKDQFDSDDYLGCCMVGMEDAVITPTIDAELPNPKWVKFFREVPGDGQGELLTLVQLIPTMGKTLPKEAKKIDIPCVDANIELILIGVRDMAPFNFQAMQAPFLEIELNSFGTSYISQTQTSKRPNPSNPNFLEKIVMPVKLPVNSIFASPLQMRAKDTRLGGYMKPIVGVCQIDLDTKLPWDLATYRAPQTDMFLQPADDRGGAGGNAAMEGILPGTNADPLALELQELKNKRLFEREADDFIASQEPVSIDQYLKGRVKEEDTGAGVFGALNHINADGVAKKKRKGEDAFTDPDWTQDDTDEPPAWSIGRKKLDAELEAELGTTPFETYPLTRGQVNGLFGSTLKTVGKVKGLVRVYRLRKQRSDGSLEPEDEVGGYGSDEPLLGKDLMDQLMNPKKYKIRLYVLRGVKLAKMDVDMWGNASGSDPYLLVNLGKDVFNDRQNAVDDVTDVDFYKMVEFDAELPGTSQLQIQVMDKDTIGSDDLIGRTTIDLEDRWFDGRWQNMGVENMITPGQDPKDAAKVRWQTKPVERRNLYQPKKSAPQGVLECWVDILKPEVATTFPPDDVSLPPKQMFEVRVVIWKTKNVPPMDSLEGMSDLYVKCWPEGCKPQETDTHWRCKKGKASFNWRILFDVELGHSTRAMKFPYFHLQLWDRDLLKWNDCAGEGTINLGKYYRKAYKRNICLKLFETKKGAAAKRAAKKEKKSRDIPDTTDDIPPEEEEKEGGDASAAAPGAGVGGDLNADGSPRRQSEIKDYTTNPLITDNNTSAKKPQAMTSTLLPPREEADSDDDDDSVLEKAAPVKVWC